MASFLDRAIDWRCRAGELRTLAERTLTPAARASLLDMAAALEHHATNLEQTALKFSGSRRRAAANDRFRSLLPRHLLAGRRRGSE